MTVALLGAFALTAGAIALVGFVGGLLYFFVFKKKSF